MKFLIVSGALTSGGAERVAANLASELNKRYETTLAVYDTRGATYDTGAAVRDMNCHRGGSTLMFHLKARNVLAKLKKELKPTHSISFLFVPDLANTLTRRKGIKTVLSVRVKPSEDTKIIQRLRDRFIFKRADMIIALSKMVKYDMVTVFGVPEEKIKVIYNPCYASSIHEKIKEDVFTEDEKEIFDKHKGRIVISVGRHEKAKGQWHLIRAFSQVVKEIPDAKLIILGRGSKREYLETLINDYKLSESVFLWGRKNNPYPYMAKADLFAFSSIFEGLGNVLIECMACAVPVVSTDCQYGPKELLAPEMDLGKTVDKISYAQYGVLVPPFDRIERSAAEPLTSSELTMSKAICEMLENEDLRDKYRKKILERGRDFDPDKITRQWLDALRQC